MSLSTLILILLPLGVNDSFAGGRRAPVETPNTSPSVTPSPVVSHVPGIPVDSKGVTFEPVAYYTTPAERAKIARAALKVNEVIQSQCFSDFMTAQKLTWTEGRTPAQVVAHLQGLTGNVPVEMYYRRFTSAVAYRNVGSPTIHLNRKVFGMGLSDCAWASTMSHEGIGHVLGNYSHSSQWNVEREYTVPYKLAGATARYGGDVFERCCK